VLHFAPENRLTGHPYVLLEWVEGERLERVAPGLAGEELDEVGRSVGGVLAAIHAATFPATGFLDQRLEVVERVDVGARGLVDYLRASLLDGQGNRRLRAD